MRFRSVALVCGLVALLAGCAAPHFPPRTTGTDSNDLLTRAHVAALLTSTPVLPGAVVAKSAPDTSLTRAAQEPVSPNLIDESRWWTAPGSAADAIDYLDSHPPAGLMLSGHSESRNATATLTSTVMFSDGSASTAYDNSQLLVTVVDRGGHVDVRADAQAIWLPPRANADAIAGAVTSLDATIDRQQSLPTVNRALDGTDARAVVNAINALSPVTPGTYNCPADLGWTDTLVVHRASGDIKVIVDVTGCANVYIGTTAARPALSGGRGIDQQLVTALGLPASYAQ